VISVTCSRRLCSIVIRKVKTGLDCFSVQMMSKCVVPDFVSQIKGKGFITLLSDMGEVLVWLVQIDGSASRH
jgi:hypothetical protein